MKKGVGSAMPAGIVSAKCRGEWQCLVKKDDLYSRRVKMVRITDKKIPKWKKYEDLVCDAMREENPDLEIQRNISIVGSISETKRQIDIAAFSYFAGQRVFAIIDCKYYSRKLDVTHVGEFLSLLNDVGANLGILVCEKGCSENATKMANKSRIKIDIRTIEELEHYKISLDFCEICNSNDEDSPGIIVWTGYDDLFNEVKDDIQIGSCNMCNTLYLKCFMCNSLFSILENQFDEPIECEGGCGTTYIVKTDYVGEGMNEYHLSVINNP
jgi:hypothetical protein